MDDSRTGQGPVAATQSVGLESMVLGETSTILLGNCAFPARQLSARMNESRGDYWNVRNTHVRVSECGGVDLRSAAARLQVEVKWRCK